MPGYIQHPDVARFRTTDRYSLAGVTAGVQSPYNQGYQMTYGYQGACKWPTPIICADGTCVSTITACPEFMLAQQGNRFRNPPPIHLYSGRSGNPAPGQHLDPEPGEERCGGSFEQRITVNVGGFKRILEPVVTPDDFGTPKPDTGLRNKPNTYTMQQLNSLAVGWGGPRELAVEKKIVDKYSRIISWMTEHSSQLTYQEKQRISNLLKGAANEFNAAKKIRETWNKYPGEGWPLIYADDAQGWAAVGPAWDPSWGPAGAENATAPGKPGYLSRFGMRRRWKVPARESLVPYRQDSRAKIWNHYLNAAKWIRCAQYVLWKGVLTSKANRRPRRSNPTTVIDTVLGQLGLKGMPWYEKRR